jgi:E3 ubiquitin-protein ligase NEDD4
VVPAKICVYQASIYYVCTPETSRLVSDMLFNPDFALWSYSSINQMCMQINPSSGIANDEHLRYFHFTGRLLGKALFDRQIVAGHLVRPL